MVQFSRNKLTSVYQKDGETLSVHGVLEDDVYGLEVDLDFKLSDLEIRKIGGRWNRMENSECPRAIPFLQEAVGFRMDDEFPQKVQKILGRKACRHFADLILECSEAVREAARLLRGVRGEERKSELEVEEYFGRVEVKGTPSDTPSPEVGLAEGPASGRRAKGETVIDLHVHSAPASPCSSITVERLIAEARQIGLDGICLTDHNHCREARALEDLRQHQGYLILGGNEITTDQGDILVFGLEEEIRGVIRLEELREKVLQAKGFMVAAHPFRGFLTFGIGYLGLTPEQASRRPLFQAVDALEVLNSRVSEKENRFAAQVAERLRLSVTGGSDAHREGEVGRFATRFPGLIRNERELIAALKEGSTTPVVLEPEAERTNVGKS
ncbi:MAG: PHP domain-containing protein [Deltaproteobacteria bacterium]|nr:PHP domain-containing protein [Deltaproteobacteria bacterium]